MTYDKHNQPAAENNRKCTICTGVQKVRSSDFLIRKKLTKTAVGSLHIFHTFEEYCPQSLLYRVNENPNMLSSSVRTNVGNGWPPIIVFGQSYSWLSVLLLITITPPNCLPLLTVFSILKMVRVRA